VLIVNATIAVWILSQNQHGVHLILSILDTVILNKKRRKRKRRHQIKKVIELLETVKEIARHGSSAAICFGIDDAMAELKAPPRWETPEQWKRRTGKAWPDNWAVYALYEYNDGERQWYCEDYGYAQHKEHRRRTNPVAIICATKAEPPPDDWKPEE
jgi:hypothetical protein